MSRAVDGRSPAAPAFTGTDGPASAFSRARNALLAHQVPDALAGDEAGAWCFELEADATIPAEYVLMRHFIGDVDPDVERRLALYLRAAQNEYGGWPLYHGGALDLSCSVKAYWALKLVGDEPSAPHMTRAREAVLAQGGAARANVFTRIALALFGHVPWRAVPLVPVELVLLPRWSPFHLGAVSYWTRCVVVPLAVLCSLRARAANPTGLGVDELFTVPPERERRWFRARGVAQRACLLLDRAARAAYPLVPGALRRRALARAQAWIEARLNGSQGLGAIFPAMVNAYEALLALGLPADDGRVRTARAALDRLLTERGEALYCQPCFSPVWDTALAAHALEEAEAAVPDEGAREALEGGLAWLTRRQVLDGPADWRSARPGLAPGGWAFQYANAHYPDLDDTAVAAWALARRARGRFAPAIERATDWLAGMQSRNGGFAAFDADNTRLWLNAIPFADHGALLDPPTEDVTARVATLLAFLRRPQDARALERALEFLLARQRADGSWWGRWGTNHVYGTWSVLAALELARRAGPGGPDALGARVAAASARAADWLESVQQEHGGWGESNDSYANPGLAGRGPATPCQTAWALLGLMAAGRGASPAVARGIGWLLAEQRADGLWASPEHNAPGFPRVFHLRYHGYSVYFPLWALARWLRERQA